MILSNQQRVRNSNLFDLMLVIVSFMQYRGYDIGFKEEEINVKYILWYDIE